MMPIKGEHPDRGALFFAMADPSHRLKVNDTVLPETIWLRRLWDFEAKEPLHASYKLVLTNELIEFLSSSEE